MALSLQRAFYLSVISVACYQRVQACLDDKSCPGSKTCCKGVCRYSCTCEGSSDCDWDEKCCSNGLCKDSFELCPNPSSALLIILAVFSGALLALLCFFLTCYLMDRCPWYKRRIARRRRLQSATVHRSHLPTLSSTNMTQELRFPEAPQPCKIPSTSYLPPFTGNPTKYSSYTVPRASTSMSQSPPFMPIKWQYTKTIIFRWLLRISKLWRTPPTSVQKASVKQLCLRCL